MLKVASKSCLGDTRHIVHAATNSYFGTVPKYLGTVPSGVGGNYDTPTTVSFSKITTLSPQTMAVDQKLENVI